MNAGPAAKRERQRTIRDIISAEPIGSQQELAERLTRRGFAVTQATVSRDIADLGLVKVARDAGHRYVATQDVAAAPPRISDERLRRILADIPVTIGRSGLVVLVTGSPGTASVIAQAIDDSTLQDQEGTLAGDNTLLVLFADESRLERWLERFEEIRSESAIPAGARGGQFMKKVVLAYSGGLDTSVAVAWLREQYDCEVVTLTIDVGGGSLREGVEKRAMSAGASRAYVVDARDRFVTDFVWPHLQANALYQGAYPLATALARPLIAQLLVEVARREGADAVAHGCTGKGNDQVRFDVAVHALDPGLEVVAPMRVGMGLTRDQEIDYAAERGIEIPITKASPYSIDVNLWGRSCETGVLEDPWVTPPADAYEWTVPASDAPAPVEVTLEFEGGIPVAIDGDRLPPVELVERISALAGAHGVGRIDHVEDRLVGIKSREIYETPAAAVLHAAHRALESLTLSKDTLRFDRLVANELAQLTYDGLWFSALHRDLRGYVASSQRVVSGEVRVRLDHGQAVVIGSPFAAIALRQEPRNIRRRRCVRPRGGRRVHQHLRAAAPGRGRPPRGGRVALRRRVDMDRSAAGVAPDQGKRP